MNSPGRQRFCGGPVVAVAVVVAALVLGGAPTATATAPRGADAPELTRSSSCVSSPFVSRPERRLWYRIPSIVRTTHGTLVAFAEARDNSDASDMGDYDIATSRSTDDGCTWSRPTVIADDGANRVSNPSALVDRETGSIMVFSSVTVRENSGGQGKGLYLQTSTDDGRTFSPLLEGPLRPDGLKSGLPGPGHGIQLRRTRPGRLIVPIAYRTSEGLYGGYGIYSDDHGRTWHNGYHQLDTSGHHDWIEGTVAELDSGDVFISYRVKKNRAPAGTARHWAVSKDGGATLAGKGFTRSTLPVVSVQGSALVPEGEHDDVLLFTSPGDPTRHLRRDMSIFVSTDAGRSWSGRYQLELQSTPAAYSDIVQLGDRVGVLYETGLGSWKERITFRSVPIAQVLNPDRIASSLSYYRNSRPVRASENAKMQVTVKVPGTRRPQGRVTLTATGKDRSRRSSSVELTYSNQGSRWITLPRLRPGSYRLTLRYSGHLRIKGTTVQGGTIKIVP